MIRASCNCGAVEFEIRANITEIFVCHCSICRRFSGTHGATVVIVPDDAFAWTRGADQVTTWRKPVGDWQSSFCKICGSALPGRNDPAHLYVPAGLIPAPADRNLKIAHHIWVDSKAGWDEIADSGKQHPQAFQG